MAKFRQIWSQWQWGIQQCDQHERFLNFLANTLSYKSSPNIWSFCFGHSYKEAKLLSNFVGYFEKHCLLRRKLLWRLLEPLFATASGHTGTNAHLAKMTTRGTDLWVGVGVKKIDLKKLNLSYRIQLTMLATLYFGVVK